MFNFAKFGNELYTGERSFDFIGKRKLWFTIAAVLVVLSCLLPVLHKGFNFGIEFSGGSQFTITTTEDQLDPAVDAAAGVTEGPAARVTKISEDKLRVQTEQLSDEETNKLTSALAEAYHVESKDISSTFIGPTWGAALSQRALLGVILFIVFVALFMALYFRTWKMSLAAISGLFVVLIITIGIYTATDFEITPPAVIGFLTILSYSLYDTVVVFDKIRENTAHFESSVKRTFADQVNLAINQTLVRSINTSVVAILPVASILFIGVFLLKAGTLKELSLALFIGTIVGTLSTIFIQAPLYVQFRTRESKVKEQAKRVDAKRQEAEAVLS